MTTQRDQTQLEFVNTNSLTKYGIENEDSSQGAVPRDTPKCHLNASKCPQNDKTKTSNL